MLLVTGAAGFIGTNVLMALNAQGRDDIIVSDDLTDGSKMQNLAGRRFADYIDCRDLANDCKPKHLTGIIHLGAISDTRAANGRELLDANFTFSKKMLELAEENECPLVYASSASVYGINAHNFQENPENEEPKAPYAISKWMFDQYVRRVTTNRACHITVPVTGLRYFNVYGPGESHKAGMASFICHCFTAIKENRDILLFNGSQDFMRDFIYVTDVADITLFFLSAKTTGIFNVGTGVATSFLDVAEMILAQNNDLNQQRHIYFTDMPAELRPQYQTYTRADVTKLGVAGWTRPFTPLEVGVSQYHKVFFT